MALIILLPFNFDLNTRLKYSVRILSISSSLIIIMAAQLRSRCGHYILPLWLPAALREAQTCRYLVYAEANFEVFRPAGATRCTDGGEIWHLLHAKFHPHRFNDKGVGPPKLKFLLRFDRNVEYKRPVGAYPLRDFQKICRVWTPFQVALGVKIWLDLLKGYGVMGVLSWQGLVIPKFSAPPSGETVPKF